MADQRTWNLSVDKNIVKLLSAATYEDFPAALREVVSNAYDADSTTVKIQVNEERDFIEIVDDGSGMTPDEFGFFLRIAGQRGKREQSRELGRSKIGQFGIGFLSVFPFGKAIRITSTALRSDIQFEAVIAAEKYINPATKIINVEDLPIPGTLSQDKKFLQRHGTTIRIEGLSALARSYFHEQRRRRSREKASIKSYSVKEQLYWSLSEDLPVDYPKGSPLAEAFKDLGSSGFRVFLNKDEIFRNDPGQFILENETWTSGNITCRYVIATDWKSVIPEENRHYKIRLKNVGIGRRTAFDLGRLGRTFSRLHWLTGEIRIVEGLNNLLSIDRSRFVDSPEYDKFSEFFRNKLSHYAMHVETVAVAERDINRQLEDAKTAEVGSKKEIVEQKLKTLEARGFKVERKSSSKNRGANKPVKIDFQNKTVEFVEDHPTLDDTIEVMGKNIKVRYEKSPAKSSGFYAVKRNPEGSISINENYGLFSSRRYGEVIRKILLTAFLILEEADVDVELVSKLARRLEKELSDIRQ